MTDNDPELVYCSKCTSHKAAEQFSKNRKSPTGRSRWCKPCVAASHVSWYANNAEQAKAKAAKWYRENKARANATAREYRKNHPEVGPNKSASRYQRLQTNPKLEWAKQAVRNARVRAGQKGVSFDLDANFVVSIAGDICPVLGIRLAYPDGDRQVMGGNGYSASIDRLDNTGGYVRGNVAVISRRANAIKTDATVTEVRAVLRWMENSCADSGPRTIHLASRRA